jgi:hypothetical protein
VGSVQYFKRPKSRGRLGKVEISLNDKLNGVEWGEFAFKTIFDHIAQGRRLKKEDQIAGHIPFVMAGVTNTGVVNYISNPVANFPKNSITVDIFGNTFYRDYAFGAGDDTGVYWNDKKAYSKETMLFFTASIAQSLSGKFDFGYKLRSSHSVNFKIQLPLKNGEIDYDFMNRFVAELEAARLAELEAYLLATGLRDYTLTAEESATLAAFENGEFEFEGFTYKTIFNQIAQGRRLKKDDQILGKIPFVMAGITNTGIVNYISNPVASFLKNSITVDIFGNTFYRNYDFGAGDDTGVYWHDKKEYSKEQMLFFTTSIAKSLFGKFDFGNKLRSSQSVNFMMQLPTKNETPDYDCMNTLMSAIQKLVIRDVVAYADRKIAATAQVIHQN